MDEVKMIDPQLFKDVMSGYPTGVSIVTTKTGDKIYGATIGSLSSLSLDPPLISLSLHQGSKSFENIKLHKNFSISILAEDQGELSSRFASKIGDKFEGVDYKESKISGCPLIEGAISWVDCVLEATHPAGDHDIIIGRVKNLHSNKRADPLLYHNRKYRKIL